MDHRAPDSTRLRARHWYLVLVALLTGLALLGAACSGPAQSVGSSAAATTQTSNAGQVTIAVSWAGPSRGAVFDVVMETHTVDLDGVDLRQLAVLRTDQSAEVRPVAWEAPKGGHHRQGTLSFPATAADGSPLFGPGTRVVELIIPDVASVPERSFRWALP
jgi:hypothetical protein